jgi:hypothetical protein
MKLCAFGATMALALAIAWSATPAAAAVLNTTNCDQDFTTGETPTASQWNFPFSCAYPQAGGLLSGPLGLPASTTSSAPFNMPPGTAPTSPSNGDIWATTAGVFIQVAGATVGPLGTQVGVTNGSNAPAGDVGEFMSSDVTQANAVSTTSGTTLNVTHVSLTPGDWDCTGTVVEITASGTTATQFTAGISTTSAALPALENATNGGTNFGLNPGSVQAMPVAPLRVNTSSAKTVFLVANFVFSGGANTAFGNVQCRRMN